MEEEMGKDNTSKIVGDRYRYITGDGRILLRVYGRRWQEIITVVW
jgi:hypothetical protein